MGTQLAHPIVGFLSPPEGLTLRRSALPGEGPLGEQLGGPEGGPDPNPAIPYRGCQCPPSPPTPLHPRSHLPFQWAIPAHRMASCGKHCCLSASGLSLATERHVASGGAGWKCQGGDPRSNISPRRKGSWWVYQCPASCNKLLQIGCLNIWRFLLSQFWRP